MQSAVAYSSSMLLRLPLPDLRTTKHHHTSSELPPVGFVGKLRPWANPKTEVADSYTNQQWNPQPVESIHDPLKKEFCAVGDEWIVLNRLLQRAGSILASVFKAQNQDLRLENYNASFPVPKEFPYIVLETSASNAKPLEK